MLVIYAWLWDYMWTVIIWGFFMIAYPFACFMIFMWFLPLQWSSIWLMWADVRNPGSGMDNRDVPAWWIGWVLGPLWGPSLKDFTSYDYLVRTRLSIVICFSSVLCLGRVEPLLCNLGNAWRTVCLHTPNSLLSDYLCMWRFINLRLSSFWDVTFMVSERSNLRIYGLVCLLSYHCNLCVAS